MRSLNQGVFFLYVLLTLVASASAQNAIELDDSVILIRAEKDIEALNVASQKARAEKDALDEISQSLQEATEAAIATLPGKLDENIDLQQLDESSLASQVELRERYLSAYRKRKQQLDRIPGLIDAQRKMIHQATEATQIAEQQALDIRPLLTELARRIKAGLIPQNKAMFGDRKVGYWRDAVAQQQVEFTAWLESYHTEKKQSDAITAPEAVENTWNLETDRHLQHEFDVASIMLQAAKHEAAESKDLEKTDHAALPTVITRLHGDWRRMLVEYEKSIESANIKREALSMLDADRRDLPSPNKESIPEGDGHSELKKARRDAAFSDQLVRYDTRRLELSQQASDLANELMKELLAIPTTFERARRETVTLKSALKLAQRWQREGKIASFDFPEDATPDSLANAMHTIAQTEATRRREVEELKQRVNNNITMETVRQELDQEEEKNRRYHNTLEEERSYATFLKEMADKDETTLIALVKPKGTLRASIEKMNEEVEHAQHEFDRAMQSLIDTRDAIRSVENPYVRMGFRRAPERLSEIKAELEKLKDAHLPQDRSADPLRLALATQPSPSVGAGADEASERNLTLLQQAKKVQDALADRQDFATGLWQYFVNLEKKIKRYTEAIDAADKAYALTDQMQSALVNEEKRMYASARELQRRLAQDRIDRSNISFDLSIALTRETIAQVQSDRNERAQAFTNRRKIHQAQRDRLLAIAEFGQWAKIRAEFADSKATLISHPVQRFETVLTNYDDLAEVDRKQLTYDAKNLREAEDVGWESLLASVSRVNKRKIFDESLDTYYLAIARINDQLLDYEKASEDFLSLIEMCNSERSQIIQAPEKLKAGLQQRILSYQTARHLAAVAASPSAQLTIEDAFKKTFGSALPAIESNHDWDKDFWANRLFAAEARLWAHRTWTNDIRRLLSRLGLDAEIAQYDQHQAKIGGKVRALRSLLENHHNAITSIRSDYSKEIYGASLRTLVSILLIPLLAWVVVRLVNRLARRIEERVVDGMARDRLTYHERMKTLSSVTRKTVAVVVWVIAALYLLHELGTPVSTILASAGVMGLAFAFGAQSLIRDFFHGFFILLENQYTIGDWIKVGGIGGTVERLTLRVTVLRDMEGTLHFIPNGSVASVSNMTHGWSQVMMEIGVGYDEDIERVSKVILDVATNVCQSSEWKDKVLSDPVVPGLQSFGDSSLNIRLVVKTQPGVQWGLARALRKRIKERFDEEGIEIPFPQRVIHHIHDDSSMALPEAKKNG